MKQIIFGTVISLISILTIIIIISLSGRAARETELETNLSNVVEATVVNTCTSKNYRIENYQEFVADFVQNLLIQMESNTDVDVQVMQADIEKSILSIKVISKYKHPNGKEGSVSCDKTVILESYSDSVADSFNIEYYVNGELYKVYSMTDGAKLIEPKTPTIEGKVFSHWIDALTSERIDFANMTIDKDYTLDAVFIN